MSEYTGNLLERNQRPRFCPDPLLYLDANNQPPITDMKLPFIEKKALEVALKKIDRTDVGKLLREFDAI